ncbi:hypothetical protein J8273_5071 [Carpediemonas membranifera]|uniref:Uncharacterized protein n=1 Tax=Carpediemonas membranifera TaxID=201153 RepID=A0A8J6B3C9_9EUKA|nr:hypothetical protein J8273_5071 [Carpediemonas membranifera]|eukprot:KAG9392099.1 hypothetical protein J8273_5071 [Carpediemonas membranifera]
MSEIIPTQISVRKACDLYIEKLHTQRVILNPLTNKRGKSKFTSVGQPNPQVSLETFKSRCNFVARTEVDHIDIRSYATRADARLKASPIIPPDVKITDFVELKLLMDGSNAMQDEMSLPDGTKGIRPKSRTFVNGREENTKAPWYVSTTDDRYRIIGETVSDSLPIEPPQARFMWVDSESEPESPTQDVTASLIVPTSP